MSGAPLAIVTVVIPHYGDPEPTLALIADLEHQRADLDCPLDIVVADDASPEPFASTAGARVVRADRNRGFGATVNLGASGAVPGVLLILNSDIRLPEGSLAGLLAGVRRHPAAITGPLMLTAAGEGHTARVLPGPMDELVGACRALDRWRGRPAMRRFRWLDVEYTGGRDYTAQWVSGAALGMTTTTFALLGGFDERFYMYFEDVYLQWRARELDIPVIALADISVQHSGGVSSGHATTAWKAHGLHTYARLTGRLPATVAALGVAAAVDLPYNVLRRARASDVAPLSELRQGLRYAVDVARGRDPRESTRRSGQSGT